MTRPLCLGLVLVGFAAAIYAVMCSTATFIAGDLLVRTFLGLLLVAVAAWAFRHRPRGRP